LLRFDLLKSELEGIDQTSRNRQLTFSNVLFTRNNSTNIDQNVRSSSVINKENVQESWITNLKFKRSNSKKGHRRIKRYRFGKVNDLKLAFSEYYLNLILLKNYQTLNYTGFRKILKKHDKLFQTTRGEDWR
jgi:SPX domain protein involved in polyphosphate accumulation